VLDAPGLETTRAGRYEGAEACGDGDGGGDAMELCRQKERRVVRLKE
jgi:hypothetical protein